MSYWFGSYSLKTFDCLVYLLITDEGVVYFVFDTDLLQLSVKRFSLCIFVVYSANALQQSQVLQIFLLRILEQGMEIKLPFIEQIFYLGFESIVNFFQLVLYALSARREILVCVQHL